MDLQPQPSPSWLQSALQWTATPLLVFLTYLITTFVNKRSRDSAIARDGAETRLADASARHTEAESQQLAWERIDVLHKIVEAKELELWKLRAIQEEVEILTSWNTRMRATLKAHNIPVPDKWQSGETKR